MPDAAITPADPAYRPRPERDGEGTAHVELRRVPELGGAELTRGRFSNFEFRRHAHERLVLACVTGGRMRMLGRGGAIDYVPGDLVTFNPDIVHWGGRASAGWQIRSLLIDHGALAEVAREYEMDVAAVRDGFLTQRLVCPELSRAFLAMHACLDDEHALALERETRLLGVLACAFARAGRHADRDVLATPAGGSAPGAPGPVERAVEYLEEHFTRNVTLAELCGVAGLSRCRLARRFAEQVGMPPHAWLINRRVREAERCLRRSEAPGAVALACGFADQAHLTRSFRACTGMTPARFRAG